MNFQIAFSQDLTFEEMQSIVQNINIDFSLFPTQNTWNNEYHPPLINTRDKREFRELLVTESRQPPNFDGRYRIVEYDADPNIKLKYFFIIDLNTGLVYDRLFRISHEIKYSIESSMIIMNPIESMDDEPNEFRSSDNKIVYAKWNGQSFSFLLFINSYPAFW